MGHFKELHNLPIRKDLLQQINQYNFDWQSNQVCINTVPGHEEDTQYGIGSLDYDKCTEQDFTVICNIFKNTVFEDIYNELKKHYVLGRVRLIQSKSKTCLSWHKDTSPRIHYPIKTQKGCLMIIENEVMHLEQNKWYLTDTLLEHTAINSSRENRLHLVAVVLTEANSDWFIQ